MLKQILSCYKVYISVSRNKVALELIERAAKLFPEARIINKFEDEAYNRVGYTLVSSLALGPSFECCSLKSVVLAMVRAAFEIIDFGLHCGTYPPLGVVDHICFHPIANASLEQAVAVAKSLAVDVGSSVQGQTTTCKIYGSESLLPKPKRLLRLTKTSLVQEPLPSAVEVESPDPLPARRKERSIASLVDITPKVLAKPFFTGRRLKKEEMVIIVFNFFS